MDKEISLTLNSKEGTEKKREIVQIKQVLCRKGRSQKGKNLKNLRNLKRMKGRRKVRRNTNTTQKDFENRIG